MSTSFRRIEGADEIFSLDEIYAGFSANGAVDLRDERGGNVDEAHAAKIAGGDKSGDVTDHASAKGDDYGATIGTG